MLNEITIKEDLNFNSVLFNSSDENQLSFSEYKERLIYYLTPILEKRFPNVPVKQQIKPYNDRLTFSCPVCGDSTHSNHKKRGNIILKGKFTNYFKCHNCGEFKRVDQFFKEFNVSLNLDIIDYISSNLNNFESYENSSYDMSMFLDVETIENYAIDREEFKKYFGLIEVKESSIWNWLVKRLQYKSEKFLYNPMKNYLLILNLTKGGKIIGAQRRLFKGENKYLTYRLSKLYELMKNESEVPEEIDAISQLFNICLINFNKPVILFEGPLDAFLLKNSICNCGANKGFPFDISIKYFYDDDNTGRKNSLEEINKGNEVFLWSKLKKDYEMPIREKWDLNDFLILCKQNQWNIPNFDKYFSGEPLDAIDI
jgi:transcription elongation factor Elf1